MNKLQYTFKTDTLFKMLFVKHQDLLEKLVAAHNDNQHHRLQPV